MKAYRILVPTDFSDASLSVLEISNSCVDILNSTIDLIHVIPSSDYMIDSLMNMGMLGDLEVDVYPSLRKKSKDKLKELAEKHILPEHRGELITVIDRKPSLAILEQANSGKYDFLLMSSKGKHASDIIRGNITQKIIRGSKIPVLSTHNPLNNFKVKNILVPVDFSDESFSILPKAMDLAKLLDANITLFHGVEEHAVSIKMPTVYIPTVNKEELFTTLKSSLDLFLNKNPKLGIRLGERESANHDSLRLVSEKDGDVFSASVNVVIERTLSANTAIVDYANKESDLVVMSTHGRTGIARIMIGSTTEQVSHHIKVPMLTLKPGGSN